MGAGAAGAASIAGLGLSAYGSILQGEGAQAGADYKASVLDRQAQFERVQAEQTAAFETQKVARDVSNIDAVRAAGHADLSSPTGTALRDWTEYLGNQKTSTDVTNILLQSQQDEADAAYMRSAGKYALLGGELGAGAGAFKAFGQTNLSSFGIGS
jgi:nitric oxide reductase large subunit